MSMIDRPLQRELLAGVEDALRHLPGLHVHSVRPEAKLDGFVADAEVLAEVKDRQVRVVIEARSSGYPRDLALVVRQLGRICRDAGAIPTVPLIAAPAISPGARELLREERVGYWDTGGSLYLELPEALYHVERPVPRSAERQLRSPFRGRSAQVLHALLTVQGREWNLKQLADHSAVSTYTAHQVVKHLEAQIWMERRGSGPHSAWTLKEPRKLLDAWAELHSLREYEHQRFYRRMPSTHALKRTVSEQLEKAGVEYALTLSSGAEMIAPFATGIDRVFALVEAGGRFEEAATAAGLRPVEEGENVTLLVSHSRSPLLFRQQVDGLWIASNIQLYLDLYAWPLRGKEQAQHLRTERIVLSA